MIRADGTATENAAGKPARYCEREGESLDVVSALHTPQNWPRRKVLADICSRGPGTVNVLGPWEVYCQVSNLYGIRVIGVDERDRQSA